MGLISDTFRHFETVSKSDFFGISGQTIDSTLKFCCKVIIDLAKIMELSRTTFCTRLVVWPAI